jgi:hypothetical protein
VGKGTKPKGEGEGGKAMSEVQFDDFYFGGAGRILAEIAKQDEHCDRLFWLAEKDMPERGVVKGEPYCAKCPRIPLIGTHCCLNAGCKERIDEANRKFKENWNKIHPENPITKW